MEAAAAAAAGCNKRKGKHRILPPPKTRKLDPVNNTCYLQILGTGMDTQDTSPSVLLFFDRRRFIFNAGEGLQRFCIEHKIKLSKIDHILLTRVCSETAGGLPGLLLTLGGIGEEGMSVNLWGPSDIKYLIEAMKVFIPNTALHTHGFGEIQNCYEAALPRSALRNSAESIILIDDEEVRISAIPIRSRPSRGAMVKPCDFAVVYACELPEIKGKLDPDKALKLGLRPSQKYSQLKCGSSVMSDCGSKMIHPSDVLGPSSPGPIVLLVDCPTPSHMLEVLSLQSLNCYYMDASDSAREGIKTVNCIIHMGPASVTKNEDYQKWMKRFGSAQHIMAGHEMKNIQISTLNSSARISSRLNYVCPQLFPASGFCSFQQTDNFFSVPSELCGKSISAENLLKFHLRPYVQLGLDRSSVPIVYNHTDFVKELLSKIPEIADSSKHVNQLWENPGEDLGKHSAFTSAEDIPFVNAFQNGWDKQNSDRPACLDNISREDLEFILLGTGSSQPSKYRNVSSVYINLFSKGSLLLDCGEGTLAQLKRRFGLQGADDAVKGLRLIWISHFHADHHAGLARILSVRCQLLKDILHKPLLVIGPEPLKRFLDAYSKLEDLDYQFLDCIYTTEDFLDAFLSSHDLDEDSLNHANKRGTQDRGVDDVSSRSLGTSLFVRGTTPRGCYNTAGNVPAGLLTVTRFKQLLHEAGLEALYSVPVTHGDVEAFGIVLKAAKRINSTGKAIPGWKIVYSGDTTPCEALINASYDATVLIHEATFEDSMEQVAGEKNHSTTKQAIEVGESAGAYRIILTHFSQRYPKIPVLDDTCMHKTCIAFDLMSVNAADLAVLPKVVPYLKDLFRTDMAID